MPTYVYETIPKSETEAPTQFEIFQKVTDEKLKKHPETGEPVRRIISGGIPLAPKKSGGDCCHRNALVTEPTLVTEPICGQ